MNKRFFERFEKLGGPESAPAIAMLGVAAAHPQLGLERFLPGTRPDLGRLHGEPLTFGFSLKDRALLEKYFLLWPMHVHAVAESWVKLVNEIGPPRLEIAQEDEKPEVLAYFAELLSRESVNTTSVYVRGSAPQTKRPLEWPLEIIAQPAQRQRIEALAMDLPGGNEWVRCSPFEDAANSHVLLVPPDVSFIPGAGRHLARTLPSSAIAIAFVPARVDAAGAMALALRLRYWLETDAVVVIHGPETVRDDTLVAILGELSGGRTLDEAVSLASRGQETPILISSREFLAKARLPARAIGANLNELLDFSEILRNRTKVPELSIPNSLARALGMEKTDVSTPELGEAIQGFLANKAQNQMSSLVAMFARLRRVLRETEQRFETTRSTQPASATLVESEAPQRSRPRYLQANVFSTEDGEHSSELGALLADTAYRVEVHIGPVLATSRFAWKLFPMERLPASDSGHELSVIFADISGGRQPPPPQVARLHLDAEGDSTRCMFEFTTPPLDPLESSGGHFTARIAVLYRNRVLQTALLSAPVVMSPESRTHLRRGVLQDVELPPTVAFESLDHLSHFDAALILNHDAAGTAGAMVVENKDVRWLKIDNVDLDEHIRQIQGRLNTLTDEEERPTHLDDERIVKLLVYLANQGRMLRDIVVEQCNTGAGLRHGKRIQVLEARWGTFIPVEFFYDFPAPHPEAKLCPNARRALEIGHCDHASHQDEDDGENYVCPAGFWGLTRVLERQRVADSAESYGDVGLRTITALRRHQIPLLHQGLVGASHQVDSHNPHSTAIVLRTLETLWPGRTQHVSDWKKWTAAVQELAPSLLVLLVHTAREESTGSQTIEIEHEPLAVSRLSERHIRQKDSNAGVLVLLLGCNPVLPQEKFLSVVGRILIKGRGSTVVVSSIAKMLGRHAGPTAATLLSGLGALVKQGPVDVGEAFVRLRRELLVSGDPLMLCLTIYGNVDWQLVAPASAEEIVDANA